MPAKSKKNIKFKPEKQERCLETIGNGQFYGVITKMLGNCQVMVKLLDEREIIAHIPGRFKKKKQKRIIVVGDIVILEFRAFQDNKSDIFFIYNKNEISQLIKDGEIPDNFQNMSSSDNDYSGVVFEDIQGTHSLFDDNNVAPTDFDFEEI